MNSMSIYQRDPNSIYRDDVNFVCDAKVLKGRKVRESQGIDSGGAYLFRVVVPSNQRTKDLASAIALSVTRAHSDYCRHEHDCCGCAHVIADVRRVSSREYVVHESVYYNV